MATTTEGNIDERFGHQRRMLIFFFMTFGYLGVEVIGGIRTGNLALLADRFQIDHTTLQVAATPDHRIAEIRFPRERG